MGDPMKENVKVQDIKSHRNDSSLRTDPHPDYEDLRIAVGNGTAKGTYSIAIGEDTVEENRESVSLLDDFTYDPSSDAFIPSSTQDPFPPSLENSFMPTSTQQQYSKPQENELKLILKPHLILKIPKTL
ncbi:DWD (DDB1-binding WD40 protein) hypersensitive toABA 2 [Striga asiatica]|uniref:DWD (DDB1-binding WD40 protein) hypersensitive toABA 2 n=1 Tax=Striga asiatica TaxID=4170 RepID=A0A5A7PLL6_STRAF|nr:DWD (DDB1-binding WD40 protein) hypersensitive toABA 2 [Striga asiatica]